MVGPVPAGTPGPAGPPGRQPRGRALAPQRRVQPRRGYPPRPAPFLKGGPVWPHHHTGGQAGPHPTGGAPNQPEGPQARQAKEGGPSPRGGPPDAAGTDKMQGRPRPKGIKAGPCILPLHFGRGCGMALPPPGQPTGQGTTGSAGPQKGIKGPVLAGGPQPPALQCRG